jgi:hypothetical protein
MLPRFAFGDARFRRAPELDVDHGVRQPEQIHRLLHPEIAREQLLVQRRMHLQERVHVEAQPGVVQDLLGRQRLSAEILPQRCPEIGAEQSLFHLVAEDAVHPDRVGQINEGGIVLEPVGPNAIVVESIKSTFAAH